MTPAEREATYGSWSAVGKSKIIKCDDDKTAHAIGNWILKQGHCAGVGWDTCYGHRVMLDNAAHALVILKYTRRLDKWRTHYPWQTVGMDDADDGDDAPTFVPRVCESASKYPVRKKSRIQQTAILTATAS